MSDFFQYTSFTALTQIYIANSLWKRLLWTILVVAMLAWMTVQCYWLLDKYYRYPVEVQMDLKVSTVLEFPSVTICNLNPILQSKVKEEPYTPLDRNVTNSVEKILNEEALKNAERGCPDNNFHCSTGQCIPLIYVCDRYPDCTNVTDDEQNCESEPVCPQNYFRCRKGRCIYMYWICDGVEDCYDGDDEQNCTESGSLNATSTESLTTSLPLSTTQVSSAEKVRRKREANSSADRRSTKDKIWHSKESQGQKRGSDVIDRLENDAVLLGDKRFTEATIHSQIMGGSTETFTDTFNDTFNDNSFTFEKMWISKDFLNTKSGYQVDGENYEAHRRVKREKSKSPDGITEDKIKNASFNIWNILANDSTFSYVFVSRDEEYLDALTYAYITAKLNSSFVEKSGHHKTDMIATCRFDGSYCYPMNFTYLHNQKYGNCYTFNSKFDNSPTLTSSFPGPENGLRLELFLDQKNYMTTLAPDAGVRVVVHKKGSMPFPEDEGISIMPGRSTSIGIRQISFFRLPYPHGSCGDTGGTTDYYRTYLGTDYSKLGCLKSCYQDLAIKYCGCAVPFYYVLDNVKVCNMTNTEIDNCVTYLPQKYSVNFETCDKLCPPPCKETKYELSISTSTWPSEKYETRLKERLNMTNSKYISIDDIDKEFIKLLIYFQDLLYEQVEQQKAYESMNLISDFGGQLGLWLGLSAITFGEICSFLFGIRKLLWYKCSWKKARPDQNDLTPVSYIEPANQQDLYEELTSQPTKYSPPDMTSSLPGSIMV